MKSVIFDLFANKLSKLWKIQKMMAISTDSGIYQTLTFSNEFMMITVLPFIYLYDGTKGYNKYIGQKSFYYFYPIHLIILGLIAFFWKNSYIFSSLWISKNNKLRSAPMLTVTRHNVGSDY